MHIARFSWPALLLLCSPLGCGGDAGPATYPVSGSVALDGEPIQEGRIAFLDPQGEIPSAGGKIVDGEFSFESQPGNKRVEITARREVPGKFQAPNPGEEKFPVLEQYIPRQYNTASELTKEVVEGENEFHLELTSDSGQNGEQK